MSRFHAVFRNRSDYCLFLVVLAVIARCWTVCNSSNINQTGCACSAPYMRPLGCARRVACAYWPVHLMESSDVSCRYVHAKSFLVLLPFLKPVRRHVWQSISLCERSFFSRRSQVCLLSSVAYSSSTDVRGIQEENT